MCVFFTLTMAFLGLTSGLGGAGFCKLITGQSDSIKHTLQTLQNISFLLPLLYAAIKRPACSKLRVSALNASYFERAECIHTEPYAKMRRTTGVQSKRSRNWVWNNEHFTPSTNAISVCEAWCLCIKRHFLCQTAAVSNLVRSVLTW